MKGVSKFVFIAALETHSITDILKVSMENLIGRTEIYRSDKILVYGIVHSLVM